MNVNNNNPPNKKNSVGIPLKTMALLVEWIVKVNLQMHEVLVGY
jgi:hypothetical protein